MQFIMIRIIFYFSFFLLTNCASFSNSVSQNAIQNESDDCIETRAVFDIGSSSTRMQVSRVDVCQKEILEDLYSAEEKIDFIESLKKSKNDSLPKAFTAQAIRSLKQLKEKSLVYQPSKWIGVVTSAFRAARNGQEVATNIQKETGILIRLVSQEEEGQIGFWGAVYRWKSGAQTNGAIQTFDMNNIIVWDIGGGSMEFSFLNKNQIVQVEEGQTASVLFKNQIITDIQKKSLSQTQSPNPLSQKIVKKALQLAQEMAAKNAKKLKLQFNKPVTVLGVGGVHWYSLRLQTDTKEFYTLKDVEKALSQKTGLTDAQIGGAYASTEISNLILVSGFMKKLGIEKVFPLKVNLTDGLLLSTALHR